MINKCRKLSSGMNFILAAFFEAAILLVPLPASILLNNALGPDNRGLLADVLLIPGIIATIVGCNWDKTLKGYLIGRQLSLQKVYQETYSLFAVQSVFGIVICMLLLLVNKYINVNYLYLYIVAIIVVIPLQLSSNYYNAILISIKNQKIVYSIKVISTTSFFVAILFFYITNLLNVTTAFFCNMLVAGTSLIACAYVLRGAISLQLKPIFINIKKVNLLHNLPSHLIETISSQFDVWLILHYVGQAEAGAYLAFKMIELPFKSISFAILNFGARIIDWGSRKKILKLILIVFLIFSTIIILFFSLESSLYNIILYFLGISYSPYLWIISYVIFNAALSNIVQLSLNSIIYDGKIREFYNIQMIIALLKIFLLVISYYFYQFKGILASLIICNLIALLFLVFFHCRSASRFQFDTSH